MLLKSKSPQLQTRIRDRSTNVLDNAFEHRGFRHQWSRSCLHNNSVGFETCMARTCHRIYCCTYPLRLSPPSWSSDLTAAAKSFRQPRTLYYQSMNWIGNVPQILDSSLSPRRACPTFIAHKLLLRNQGDWWGPDVGRIFYGDSARTYVFAYWCQKKAKDLDVGWDGGKEMEKQRNRRK